MADNSVTTVGSALIPLVNAQQQRALSFPQEIERQREENPVDRSRQTASLDEGQRNRLGSRAATLTRDDDTAGLTTRARQAVQAYQSQAVDAEREQISSLLGVDTYA